MTYILITITIILDYFFSYFSLNTFNNLSCFFPMFTLTLIIYLYNIISHKKYFKTIFTIGLIYDLLFSYIFLFNALIFLMFGKIIKKIDKYIKCNLVINLLLLVLFIFIYDLILYFLVYISKYNVVTFLDFIYKFKNSLLINGLFYILLVIIFKNKKW